MHHGLGGVFMVRVVVMVMVRVRIKVWGFGLAIGLQSVVKASASYLSDTDT